MPVPAIFNSTQIYNHVESDSAALKASNILAIASVNIRHAESAIQE
jgi:hypothetical protein